MNKVTSKYKGHVIVVEVESAGEPTKHWLTSWIDGFTFSRRAVFTYGNTASTQANNEHDKIVGLLANDAIIRHTFTDKYGNLHYWQKCTNIDQIGKPEFTPIWPADKQEL